MQKTVLSVALLPTHNTKSFLKSPCHEDSGKVYHVYGDQKFTRLAVREV